MAFSGVTVTCAQVGEAGLGYVGSAMLLGRLLWSEQMASAGTTTNSAPTNGGPEISFEIRSAADAWVSYGATPNASSGPRILVPANETRNVLCNPGDKVAWIAA